MKQPFTAIDFANGLRALADFYEAHPEMPLPYPDHHVFMYDREPFLRAVKELADSGRVTKEADNRDESWPRFHAIRMFGPVRLDVEIDRKTICRLVEPARPAVYECPDSLLEEAAEFEERS